MTHTAVADTMTRMSKKKTGGQHTTARKGVNLPADWHVLASRLAASRPTGITWYVIELIRDDAIKFGVPAGEIPPVPWPEPFPEKTKKPKD